MIEYRVGEWRSGPVVVASRFWQRMVGLMGNPAHGLVLSTKSVHGMGMRSVVGLIGLNRAGQVIRTTTLRPWRFVFWWDVARIIEVPQSRGLPTAPRGFLVEVEVEVDVAEVPSE